MNIRTMFERKVRQLEILDNDNDEIENKHIN